MAQVLGRTTPVPLEMVALEGYTESGKSGQLIDKYHLSSVDVEAAVKRVLKRKAG